MNRLLRWLSLVSGAGSLALSGCGNEPLADYQTLCEQAEAKVKLTSPESGATGLQGDVSLLVTLFHGDGEAGEVEVFYRVGEDGWQEATLREDLGSLSSSPEGTDHALTWDAVTDLGYVDLDSVSLRVSASSTCGPWTSGEVENLTVYQEEYDLCRVALGEIPDPASGLLPVYFSLTRSDTADAWVSVKMLDEGAPGSTLRPATLRTDLDCDGDGVADDDDGLTAAPDGSPHCLMWDSSADITATDSVAHLEMTCGVGFREGSPSSTVSFAVTNSVVPEEGDVLLSEILVHSDASVNGSYLELWNPSERTLNLHGMTLVQLDASGGPSGSSLELSGPGGLLPLDPGAYLVIAATSDLSLSGCIPADLTWPDTFSLKEERVYALLAEGGQEVDRADGTGWEFDDGVALGWDPLSGGWCPQSEPIPSCGEAPATDIGTPGQPNTSCP